MGEREKRLARNETLFREVNERVAEIAPDFLESVTRDEAVQFVCECWRSERTEPISLTLVEYEAIRADRFRRSRASVERHPAYLVVEKREE